MGRRRFSNLICSLPHKQVGGIFLAGCMLAAAIKTTQAAPIGDNFESAEITWRPSDADVQYRLENHARINSDPHSGQRSELLQINAGAGTYVYFVHDLQPARVVAELMPSVWIKANRPGVQFFARVVLPHTPDPRSGQPVTALLAGSSYSTVGLWQQLSVSDTPQLLSREVRALRAQLGPQVDAREAYIDQLLLNVYGGPGQTMVNIDDLAVNGVVPFANSAPTASTQIGANNAGPALNTNAVVNIPTPSPLAQALPVDSAAPLNAAAAPSTPNVPNSSTARQVIINGSLFMVDGKPIFPRIIQSQGEPLEWLAQEGFTVVRSMGPLTDGMLTEATRTGIRLIGPPPIANSQGIVDPQNTNPQSTASADALAPITAAFAPVMAWHLGSGLAARELTATAALSKQLRLADHVLRRPLVCNPEEDALAYSRQADVLAETCFPLGTSLELKDYATWLGQRPRLARPGTPLWAVIQTEVQPAAIDQAAAFLGQSRLPPVQEPMVEPGALRLLAYQAFCSGARGIEFASNSRLDAADNATRLRATELALLNLELDLIEPWGAAGSYVTFATSSDPNISSIVLNYENTRLVVTMRVPNHSQFVPAPDTTGTILGPAASTPSGTGGSGLAGIKPKNLGGNPNLKSPRTLLEREAAGNGMTDSSHDQTYLRSANRDPLFPDAVTPSKSGAATLVVPGVPEDYRAYELTIAGLRPLRKSIVSGGTSIALEDFLLTSVVLVTADPTIVTNMQRRTTELAPRAAQLQRRLTAYLLEQTAAVNQRLGNHPELPAATTPLATAATGLQQADALLSAGQYAQAYLTARNAAYPLEHWQRDIWERSVKPLQSPVSSPLAVSFNTLPEQINFAASIAQLPPGENLLRGGDFEDLQTMLQAGWKHFQHARADLRTDVELSPLAPFAGLHSLHLSVQTAKPEKPAAVAAMLVESPPLWITSAPVHVSAGDIVCIRGQVRVRGPVVGSVDGLMILDSFGGEALAQRIMQTDGWREFVMYRAAGHADNLTVTFALTGLGEAWVDELSIRPLRSGDSSSTGNFTALGISRK
ncbi:MAG TPA: hypothetical protein VFE46_16935 [Pirellulales bacterium]|nr:hypothetical protein [Pirellulales bacterium]